MTTPLDVKVIYKVTAAESCGAFALIEYSAPPHFRGLAPHWHAHTTELLYVTAGVVAVTLGEETVTATKGTALVILPGILHTFWNPTADAATLMITCAPGGGERYFTEVAALLPTTSVWHATQDAAQTELNEQYDVWWPSPEAGERPRASG